MHTGVRKEIYWSAWKCARIEEGTFSCATIGSLRPPIHSSSEGDRVPSGRACLVGSSAYFFLLILGFLNGWVPSSPSSGRALMVLLKCKDAVLLAQHAIEEEGVESICAEGRRRKRRATGSGHSLWRDMEWEPRKRPSVRRSLNLPATQVAFPFHDEKAVVLAQDRLVSPTYSPSSLHHVVRWQT